jgi:methionine sulfoxide reductase catalytic subunit
MKKPWDLPSAAATPRSTYLRRRDFLRLGAAGAGAVLLGGPQATQAKGADHGEKLPGVSPGPKQFDTDEKKTPFDDITSYNNFYEFGTDKDDPAHNAHSLKTRPWTVEVEGEIKTPRKIAIDELQKMFPLEERTYRMRCVEAWSMVIPWDGWPLASLIKKLEPTSRAKYVAFQTLLDPEQMPGQKSSSGIQYPYVEGLRMDEAMNPLTLLAFGLYGETMPKQDGAPMRLVTPWKYGFKGIKSIVKIRFQETQPPTTWGMYGGGTEYGFYANVNPEVDHPRWSQARERRIGEFLRRKTLPFNGYGDQVASLYAGMDLRKFF